MLTCKDIDKNLLYTGVLDSMLTCKDIVTNLLYTGVLDSMLTCKDIVKNLLYNGLYLNVNNTQHCKDSIKTLIV